ncbi:MAG TPA: helix-turn-helix transcriptional regulator [Pseudonocardiaceae bacterium]
MKRLRGMIEYVSDKPGPTLRAQWLGQQLRELRNAAEFTLKQAGDYLQRDTSTVGRFESGEYPIRRPDMLALLDFYGVSDKHRRDGLLQLHADSWQKGWWDGYAEDVEQSFVDFVWLESRATEILAFDNTVLTGLLQTDNYARAVITATDRSASPEQIERGVELRMARQEVLGKPDFQLQVVLDESVLHRQVHSTNVMREQFAHLATLARQSNVEIRVLPFSAGEHPSSTGGLMILRMSEPYPEVGYVETPAGSLYVEPPRTERFRAAYDGLCKLTLGPRKSIEVITALTKE